MAGPGTRGSTRWGSLRIDDLPIELVNQFVIGISITEWLTSSFAPDQASTLGLAL
jgi:hypothetical protein